MAFEYHIGQYIWPWLIIMGSPATNFELVKDMANITVAGNLCREGYFSVGNADYYWTPKVRKKYIIDLLLLLLLLDIYSAHTY